MCRAPLSWPIQRYSSPRLRHPPTALAETARPITPAAPSRSRRASSAMHRAFHNLVALTLMTTESFWCMPYFTSEPKMPRGTALGVSSVPTMAAPSAMRVCGELLCSRRRCDQRRLVRGFDCGVVGFVRWVNSRIVAAFNRPRHLRNCGVEVPSLVQAGNANTVLAVDLRAWRSTGHLSPGGRRTAPAWPGGVGVLSACRSGPSVPTSPAS
jgi:hypothetical protein